MKLAIVIPVYNEEKYIGTFLKSLFLEIKSVPQIKTAFVVDDGSTDKTAQILKKYEDRLVIMTHLKNQGKGRAMKTGLSQIKKLKLDGVIFMDGDLQHNPRHLSQFVSALVSDKLVFGYRKLSRSAPWVRKIGNDLARLVLRSFFHIKRRDVLCGYMGMRREMFTILSWTTDNYGVEAEISAMVGRENLAFKEILVDTIYMDSRKGMNLFDALLVLFKVPYWYVHH